MIYSDDPSSKNATYCIANFPSYKIEVLLTLYTVMMSYVLPLMTIIFCYARMIVKIIRKSKEQLFYEHSRSFKSSKKKIFAKGNKKADKSNEPTNEKSFVSSSSNNQVI